MERVRSLEQFIEALNMLLTFGLFIAMCLNGLKILDELSENNKEWKEYKDSAPIGMFQADTRIKPPSRLDTVLYASIPLCMTFLLYMFKVLSIGSFYVLIQNAENSDRTNKLLEDLLKESRKTKL